MAPELLLCLAADAKAEEFACFLSIGPWHSGSYPMLRRKLQHFCFQFDVTTNFFQFGSKLTPPAQRPCLTQHCS